MVSFRANLRDTYPRIWLLDSYQFLNGSEEDILVLFAGNIPKFLVRTKKNFKKNSEKILHENKESQPQISSSDKLYATEFQCQ